MQGFYFALLQYSHTQAFTARFVPSVQLYRPRRKTVHRALQWLFLRLHPLNRLQYQTDTSGYNTTCDTLEHTTAPQHLQHIPDTSATPDAVQASGAAYYNKVYKERSPVMDPCQTVQHTADHSSPAGSAPTACGSLANATLGAPAEGSASPPIQGQSGTLHPAGQSSSRGRGGRRGTIGGYRRISFRAVAR